MAAYRPPSTRDITLQVKLNREQDIHNGEDYAAFQYYREIGLNRKAMAKLFKVTGHTMSRWWLIDDEEQKPKRGKK